LRVPNHRDASCRGTGQPRACHVRRDLRPDHGRVAAGYPGGAGRFILSRPKGRPHRWSRHALCGPKAGLGVVEMHIHHLELTRGRVRPKGITSDLRNHWGSGPEPRSKQEILPNAGRVTEAKHEIWFSWGPSRSVGTFPEEIRQTTRGSRSIPEREGIRMSIHVSSPQKSSSGKTRVSSQPCQIPPHARQHIFRRVR